MLTKFNYQSGTRIGKHIEDACRVLTFYGIPRRARWKGHEPHVTLGIEASLTDNRSLILKNVHLGWVANDKFYIYSGKGDQVVSRPNQDASSINGRFPDSPQSRSDKLRGKELIKAKKTKAGRFTFPSANLKQEMVLIFASTPRRCSVVQKADINETGESDHRPVMADFFKE